MSADLLEHYAVGPLLAWLPDETLFSLCSRHHRLSGRGVSAETSRALFGHRSTGSQHDFPNRIGEFCRRTYNAYGDVEQLARGRMNVTVNCVAYGLIKTRLTGDVADGTTAQIDGRDIRVGINTDLMHALERTIPLGRVGSVEEAAGAVYLLCIPESDYVSGQTLLCSGGLTGI